MSSPIVIDNGNLSTPNIKPDSNIFFNRDGTITGKAGYTYKYGAYTGGFAIGGTHPYDSSAFLAQFGETFDAAGMVEMDGDYVGVWSTTNYMVDGIAATQQDPIETNPGFSTFGGVYNASFNPNPATGAYFDPTTQQFVGWVPGAYTGMDQDVMDLVGVQSWLVGGLVIRVTNATTSSGDVTSALGSVGIASMGITAGIISFSYGYNAFLCTNATYKEVPIGPSSATFTVTVEYTYTPPNGWNDLIYP